jgi:hypothetical protein
MALVAAKDRQSADARREEPMAAVQRCDRGDWSRGRRRDFGQRCSRWDEGSLDRLDDREAVRVLEDPDACAVGWSNGERPGLRPRRSGPARRTPFLPSASLDRCQSARNGPNGPSIRYRVPAVVFSDPRVRRVAARQSPCGAAGPELLVGPSRQRRAKERPALRAVRKRGVRSLGLISRQSGLGA